MNISRSEVLRMLHLLQNDIDDLSVTIKTINPNFIDPGAPEGKSCETWFAEARNRIYMMNEALKEQSAKKLTMETMLKAFEQVKDSVKKEIVEDKSCI